MTYPESERPSEPERDPASPAQPEPAPPGEPRKQAGGASRWTGGRIASVVIGSVLALIAIGLLIVGTVAMIIDQTQRDDDFVSFGTETFSSEGFAIASDRIDVRGVDWDTVNTLIGDVRVRATSVGTDQPVFIGIGPADAVEQYLAGVAHTIIHDIEASGTDQETVEGGPPPAPPEEVDIWAVEVNGPGTQDLVFPAVDGEWALVAMNQDASAGVDVRVQTAATLPSLFEFAIWSLVIGAVLLAGGLALIIIAARRASADRQQPGPPRDAAYVE